MSRPDSAVVFRKIGGPEVLAVEDASPRPLAENDVRINVAAFALNRADLMFIHGEHYTVPVFPSRIGSEAVGTVTEIGGNVTAFNIGDRVTSIPFFTTTDGVQGTTAVLPADYLTLAPPELSDAEACSVWMQYLTSYFAFAEVADLGSEDTVLVREDCRRSKLALRRLGPCPWTVRRTRTGVCPGMHPAVRGVLSGSQGHLRKSFYPA